MHNIFQPLSSVALLQQRRQHHLKEEQLKWELADWDLATKTNKTNLCTTEYTCKSTSFCWVKGGGRGEGKGAKEDVVNFKINVSPSRGYMKLSDWRFNSFAVSGWFWGKHAVETCQISDHKQGLCKSDQHQFSPDSSNAYLKKKKVMRINNTSTKGKMLWSFIKFSQLIL